MHVRSSLLVASISLAVVAPARAEGESPKEIAPPAAQDAQPGVPQEAKPESPPGEGKPIEEIVITGTKKRGAVRLQDLPMSANALKGDLLEARQVRTLEDLTFSLPNATLDGVGTAKGVANFSMRGLGINSSIPSIDPTVGVFVDGVYLGGAWGVILDTFDLESVEVLRGAQGLLFGRNVTGGAVLLRSRRPGPELSASARLGAETGLESFAGLSVNVPLIDNMLYGRVSGQFRYDEGWFENVYTGDKHGFEQTGVVRASAMALPMPGLDVTAIYERGDVLGDGPAAHNRRYFNGFDIGIDRKGKTDLEWNQATLEANYELGKGEITNIFGYRTVDQRSALDVDSMSRDLFFAMVQTDQTQLSNELRYSARYFDRWDTTVGGYFMTQELSYRERRQLAGLVDSTLGGNQDSQTYGVFTQNDVDLISSLTLTLGARYTIEKKSVEIATFNAAASRCGKLDDECTFDFEDDEKWSNFMPKVGVQVRPLKDLQIYAHWTRGFRSGGYNLRNTSPAASPGPFGEELQDAYELGVKSVLFDRRLTVNLATFLSEMKDLQREVNVPSSSTAVVQIIKNTADARIYGLEVDATARLSRRLTLASSLGLTRGAYTKVRFDISSDTDRVVDQRDKDLEIPRLVPLTFNAAAAYTVDVAAAAELSLRMDYNYRDASFFSDNNKGTLPSAHMLGAGIDLTLQKVDFLVKDGTLKFSVYGKNWLNEIVWGADTILPDTLIGQELGGTFSPLQEGRVFGLEVRADL